MVKLKSDNKKRQVVTSTSIDTPGPIHSPTCKYSKQAQKITLEPPENDNQAHLLQVIERELRKSGAKVPGLTIEQPNYCSLEPKSNSLIETMDILLKKPNWDNSMQRKAVEEAKN